MAEGARLESVFRGNSNVGSNPTLSARIWKKSFKISNIYNMQRVVFVGFPGKSAQIVHILHCLMLRETIAAGIRMGAIRSADLKRINVDTTVQTKAVRYPTDARLYHRSRERLVKMARREGVVIKQSYRHVGKRLLLASSRYAHARQMKRARACTRKLRTQLGRVVREIERQVREPSEKLSRLLATAHRIHAQQRHDKNKVYSVHEPEVECIAKGKAGKPYEFGNKVSVAVTSRGGWLVGAKSFTGNPYDGHTLAAQMKQVRNMIGDRVAEAHVDMGYRGHDYAGAVMVHVDKRTRGRTSKALWRWMKRRAAVEPSIGHLKNEHRLERNRLRGIYGDAINAMLAAAAMNFHKLLGAFWLYLLHRLLGPWKQFGLSSAPIGPKISWDSI